mgnify:CR=1 FL=1
MAKVDITVVGGLFAPIKLIDDVTFPAGTSNNVCTWDGKDEEGKLVLPGQYTIKMKATDGYGNQDVKEIPVTINGTIVEG